jgi:TonB family protein
MKSNIALSLLFHIGLLVLINRAFPVAKWFKEPLKTYRVEFLRPPIEDLHEITEPDAASAAEFRKETQPPPPTEDTISLDTRDAKYVDYAGVIRERLMRHWEYPLTAREDLIEGDVLLLFTLDKAGNLEGASILNSSSFDVLDREAVRAVMAAAPFPPFPDTVRVMKLHIRAHFAYKLSTGG